MTEHRGTTVRIVKGYTITRNTYRRRTKEGFWGKEYHKYQAAKNGLSTMRSYNTMKQAIKNLTK